jgi:hypothetical protein
MIVPITLYELVESVRYVEVDPLDIGLDHDATLSEIVEAVVDIFSGVDFENVAGAPGFNVWTDNMTDIVYDIRDTVPVHLETTESHLTPGYF